MVGAPREFAVGAGNTHPSPSTCPGYKAAFGSAVPGFTSRYFPCPSGGTQSEFVSGVEACPETCAM